jgi:acylphosphatase
VSHERLDATVHGRVQGVGFRYYVIQRAMDLDLTGWVANEPDGSVRCLAEGRRAALDALVDALERGPAGAIVERVSTDWGPATGRFTSFEVRSRDHRGD